MIGYTTARILETWRVARLVLVVAFAAGTLAYCAGCGGGLLAQARAATIATVALEGGRRMIVEVAERRSAACTDEPCVLAVREEMRPAEAGYEALRLSVSSWVSALDVAHLAGVGEELLPALITAALRFVEGWADFSAALAAVGVELPALPDALLVDAGAP